MKFIFPQNFSLCLFSGAVSLSLTGYEAPKRGYRDTCGNVLHKAYPLIWSKNIGIRKGFRENIITGILDSERRESGIMRKKFGTILPKIIIKTGDRYKRDLNGTSSGAHPRLWLLDREV